MSQWSDYFGYFFHFAHIVRFNSIAVWARGVCISTICANLSAKSINNSNIERFKLLSCIAFWTVEILIEINWEKPFCSTKTKWKRAKYKIRFQEKPNISHTTSLFVEKKRNEKQQKKCLNYGASSGNWNWIQTRRRDAFVVKAVSKQNRIIAEQVERTSKWATESIRWKYWKNKRSGKEIKSAEENRKMWSFILQTNIHHLLQLIICAKAQSAERSREHFFFT